MTEDLAALALGAAGSLHCAAMCGPLVLLLRAAPMAPATRRARYVVPAVYHAGRLSMYATGGFAAGLAGHAIAFRAGGRVLAWLAGAVLLASAASHLGWRLPQSGFPLAGLVARLVRAGRIRSTTHPLAAAVIGGALNACLPCGMLYAALASAAALANPVAGFRFMLLFGLATTPALAAVTLAGGWLGPEARRHLRHATPIALALVGLLLLARGQSAPHDPGGSAAAAVPAAPRAIHGH